MMRNLVLALVTLAILLALYLVYTLWLGPSSFRSQPPQLEQLPPQADADVAPLVFGPDVSVPGGRRIVYRRYSERTGQPTDVFSCSDWQPVAGSQTEIRVSEPELILLLPSGMTATISAQTGQLTSERSERAELRPKAGWLEGAVEIVIDRETEPNQPPAAERPEDLIRISLTRVEFDLERGELRTRDRLLVSSDEFEVAGTGLDLVWSQADNRVETLTVAQGEQFVYYGSAGLFEAAERPAPAPADAAEAPEKPPAQPPGRRRPVRGPTAYTCVLSGDVVAEQTQAEQVTGSLSADQINLVFDVGAGAGRALRPRPATQPTTLPATTQATRDGGDRLVVRWSGPLRLEPATGPAAQSRRLQFVATGNPVVLSRGEGTIRAGRVEYHDETQRIWLDPLPGERLPMRLGEKLSAQTSGVFIDREARIVKLVGPMELTSARGRGVGGERSSIRATQWGELRLAAPETQPTTRPAIDAATDFQRLESARFVGEVVVRLQGQRLRAERLDVGFRTDAEEETLEALLERASASGGVRLSDDDGRLACERMDLVFDRTPTGEPFPRELVALGRAELRRGQARVRGNRVEATMQAAPPDAPPGSPAFVIRSLEVTEAAELLDPDNRVAARGERLSARFEQLSRLTTAFVAGTPTAWARLQADDYVVRGERIDLDRAAQLLVVDGPSRMTLPSQRSLQGAPRAAGSRVLVTASRSLRIDGRGNTVDFVGNVLARSDFESLASERMTLYLADVPPPQQQQQPRRPRFTWTDVWHELQRGVGITPAPQRSRPAFDVAGDDEAVRVRKDPVRLAAEQALMQSESYADGLETPIIHASISAPRLEVDIAQRQITTIGLTELLMLDRRAGGAAADAEQTSETLGLPSALVSRGPSQTAMRCTGRMTYTLGPDGPARRDAVVFEDNVVFVHRTGREMIQVEQAFPHLATDPNQLARLETRSATLECRRLEGWFNVDEAGGSATRGGGLTRTPLRLSALVASGDVYLRDTQGSKVREVTADWVEFNRDQSRIAVRGGPGADAQVFLQDTAASLFDVHTARELVINLVDGTIRSGQATGELRRP